MAEGLEEHPEQSVALRDKPVSEISSTLQEVLGQRLVAYAICERDPRQVGVFARAEASPDEAAEARLRDLAEVTEFLGENASPEVIRAIMVGMNPTINDESVIELFHRGESERAVAAAPYLNN